MSKDFTKKRIKAIVYDCVGPLLIKNTQIALTPVVSEINNKCGGAIDEKKFWREVRRGYNLTVKELESVKEQIVNYYILNKEMQDFNKKIFNNYKTAIINNGANSIFKKWIVKFGFKQRFDVLLNSTELGIKKPDPRIYKLVAKKLNVLPEECVFIDDNEINTIGSEKVGMVGITYNPGHHKDFIEKINKVLD